MGNVWVMSDPMSLREWLDAQGMNVKTFGPMVDTHWVTVYKWMSGRSRPSFGVMAKIERATQGRVTARSLVGAHRAKHEPESGRVTTDAA